MAIKDPIRIAPADGKLGVLLPGIGAVSTTFMAGVEAVKRGLGVPIGSLTQLATVRLGKRTDGRAPLIKDFVPLANLSDLEFGGWDIYEDNAYEAARKAAVLDPHLRKDALNEGKRRAWLYDQYKHPHESKHTYGEVLKWFDQCGIEFVTSIPTCAGSPLLRTDRLFDQLEPPPTRTARFMTQAGMLLKGGAEGGLFIMIGRKTA